jgi:hypothetical protein
MDVNRFTEGGSNELKERPTCYERTYTSFNVLAKVDYIFQLNKFYEIKITIYYKFNIK